jgi:hypothetical protein
MYSPIRESIPKLELEFDIQLDFKNVNRFEIRNWKRIWKFKYQSITSNIVIKAPII